MEKIIITHFVNPHLFWFKIEPSDQAELLDLEYKISKIAHCNHDQQRVYKLGDCVAVYYMKWQKHVRGFVLEVNQQPTTNSYTVWLVDHGFSVVSESRHMKYLPEEFRRLIPNVHRGGIADIMPVKSADFAITSSKPDLKRTENWSERACLQLSNYLAEQKNNISIQILYLQQTNKHIWCDLKMKIGLGGQCFVSDWLVRNNLAERIERAEFKRICGCFMTLRDFESNCLKNEKILPSPMLDEVVQASQNKVNQWLKQNFLQTQDNDFFDEELQSDDANSFRNVDCRTHDMLQAAGKMLSSSKLPPMPDVSAFDLFCEHIMTSELANEQELKAEIIEYEKSWKVVMDHTDIIEDKVPVMQTVQKTTKPCIKAEPYISPFEDKYVRPNCEKRMQERPKFRMLPAGFDVTQLVEYRNPNHWHRSKTTRDLVVPHDEFVLVGETKQQESKAQKSQYEGDQGNPLKSGAEHTKTKPNGKQACKSAESIRAVENPMLNIPPPNDTELFCTAADAKMPHASWSELSCQLTQIKLGYNTDWRNIFVQLSGSEDIRQFETLQKLLKKQAEHLTPVATKLSSFELGRDYVVKWNDSYFRAQLERILDHNRLRFFFVDLAFFHDVIIKNDSHNIIYKSTHEIIKYMPFQAVHCTLVGVHLKPNLHSNFTVGPKQPLFVFACVKETNKAIVNLNINSYKVGLYVCDEHVEINDVGIPQSATLLNRQFLTMQLAYNDPDTELYLESHFGLQEDQMSLNNVALCQECSY